MHFLHFFFFFEGGGGGGLHQFELPNRPAWVCDHTTLIMIFEKFDIE